LSFDNASKFTVDTILIYKTNRLTKKKIRYLILAVLYPFFSTSVALYSLFGKYEWKGEDSNLHYNHSPDGSGILFSFFFKRKMMNNWK
jgi:hypothetical protein